MQRAEHKIGETIEYGEVTLEVAKQPGDMYNPCALCYFEHLPCWYYDIESCAGSVRDDNTNIIFVKVEKEEA